MNLSIYEIITYFSYLLGFIVYLFYGYKLNNNYEPIHEKTKYIYDFILVLFTYIPYIVSIIWIFYKNMGIKYQYYILINVLLIIFIFTPMIVFKDDILTGEYTMNIITKEDYLDNNKYDKNGKLIGKKKLSDKELDIKKRSAESEFNNRYDLRSGIYD